MQKPAQLIDRDREWRLLSDFVADPAPMLRLAIVSGRRRFGKSFLLEALTEQYGGLYLNAVQEEGKIPAQHRFIDAIAAYAGLRPGSLKLDDWQDILTAALNVVGQKSGAPLIVIDELPYLMQHSPEVPGFLQLLYDQSQVGKGPGGRIILCGSAMSVMTELLSGTKPLRGRAIVDLRLSAFDYRTARQHWEIDNPEIAFKVHSVLGGAPGYRPLAVGPAPQTDAEFDKWITQTLLDLGLTLYSRVEAEYLLREDPRITHRTLYYDLLSAVAQGASTPSKIGAALSRQRSAVVSPLENLESTGYLRKEQDLLRDQHPVITVTDPVIRFNQLITLPQADLVERGRAAEVWINSQPTFKSKILGPHFEELAREWTRSFAYDETNLRIGNVGIAEISDRAARTKHEIDVIGLAPGTRPRAPRAQIALIGEAKATIVPRGISDIERLEHIRGLLANQGHEVANTTLALFSRNGFYPDLLALAGRRSDLLLVDLAALYGEGPLYGVGS